MLTLQYLAVLLNVQLESVRDAGGQLFGVANPLATVNIEQANAIRTQLIKWGRKPV